MKRTINSTGRKSLQRENLTLRLVAGAEGPPSFTASFSGLLEMGLPSDARIYVQPYAGSSSMRFEFGTVGLVLPPSDTRLTDLDVGPTILFDVKIVDESDVVGRLLATARQLRPGSSEDDGSDRKSLLPVETADLGELLWRLDAPEGAQPKLQINSRIPGALGRLKTDPLMQGCILPVAIGIILNRILDPLSGDTDEHEWVTNWVTWIRDISGHAMEEINDPDLRETAVAEICSRFASQMTFASRCAAAVDLDPELTSDD